MLELYPSGQALGPVNSCHHATDHLSEQNVSGSRQAGSSAAAVWNRGSHLDLQYMAERLEEAQPLGFRNATSNGQRGRYKAAGLRLIEANFRTMMSSYEVLYLHDQAFSVLLYQMSSI